MEHHHISIIGFIAGICTSISFFPQIMKIISSKKVRDISLGMYVILTIGISLWLIYGVLLGEPPIIFANGLALVMCLFVLSMKIAYRNND